MVTVCVCVHANTIQTREHSAFHSLCFCDFEYKRFRDFQTFTNRVRISVELGRNLDMSPQIRTQLTFLACIKHNQSGNVFIGPTYNNKKISKLFYEFVLLNGIPLFACLFVDRLMYLVLHIP